MRFAMALVLGGALALSGCDSDGGSGSAGSGGTAGAGGEGGAGGAQAPRITMVAWATDTPCPNPDPNTDATDYTVTVTAEDDTPGELTYAGSVTGCTGAINAAVSTINCPNAAPYGGGVTVTDPQGNDDAVTFNIGVCSDDSITY